jgi:hypothetical protein
MSTINRDPDTPAHRALILIPGTINHFYNLSGRRIAEALRELGFAVRLSTLSDEIDRDGDSDAGYDLCVLSSIMEMLNAYGDQAGGLDRIRAIGRRCRVLASLTLECISMHWHHRLHEFSVAAGADLILDLGVYDQSEFRAPDDPLEYRFVFSGLTPSERRRLDAQDDIDANRTIPWAFVGQATAERAALVDHLIQTVDPRGFVYMAGTMPYAEKGSPHLNQEQFEKVLERTRYQIWCSHHSYFYMETERFRASLLTGSVPIKIVDSRDSVPLSAPFRYLVWEPGELKGRVTDDRFGPLRQRFRQDWLGFPTLSAALAPVLTEAGILASSRSSQAA